MHDAKGRLLQPQAPNRPAHTIRSRQQQIRERLELQALALGADHRLAQLAADAWLREVDQ